MCWSGSNLQENGGKPFNNAVLVDMESGKILSTIGSYRKVGYGPVSCRNQVGGMYSRTNYRIDDGQIVDAFNEQAATTGRTRVRRHLPAATSTSAR